MLVATYLQRVIAMRDEKKAAFLSLVTNERLVLSKPGDNVKC